MIKLIHINSSARSGSTLLSILLDQFSPIFSGGELFRYTRIWTRWDSQITADGTTLKSSEFWARVKQAMESQLPAEFTDNIIEDKFTESEVVSLHKAILEESGCQYICDSSKSPSYTNIIYNTKHFSPIIIHLVRDGRAVVYSKNENLYAKCLTAIKWTFTNAYTRWRQKSNKNYFLVTYDQLVNDTNQTLRDIKALIKANHDIELDYNNQNLTARYMFAGNTMRHTFDGTIKYDRRYIDNLPASHWWILTTLMLPGILLFNIPVTKSGLVKTHAIPNE